MDSRSKLITFFGLTIWVVSLLIPEVGIFGYLPLVPVFVLGYVAFLSGSLSALVVYAKPHKLSNLWHVGLAIYYPAYFLAKIQIYSGGSHRTSWFIFWMVIAIAGLASVKQGSDILDEDKKRAVKGATNMNGFTSHISV